ncbi:hypothetical protein [Salana multivorans]
MNQQIVDPLVRSRQRAHSDAVRAEWADVVSTLSANLGNSVVALMAGVASETVSRWSDRRRKVSPHAASERRLRDAYAIYSELVKVDAPHTVRAWFIGSNPYLGDASPAETIAAGDASTVFAAARAFRDLG